MLRQSILNRGELGIKLSRQIRFRDGRVMVWELVALETKGADPNQSLEINPAEGVDHGGASSAPEGSIRECMNIWVRTNRRN